MNTCANRGRKNFGRPFPVGKGVNWIVVVLVIVSVLLPGCTTNTPDNGPANDAPAEGQEGPIASFQSSCDEFLCIFNGTNSQAGNQPIRLWLWHMGEGNATTGPIVEWNYEQPGCYVITLTVQDEVDLTDTAFTRIRLDEDGRARSIC